MISTRAEKSASRTRRRRDGVGRPIVSWKEVWLAEELSRCLEDADNGRSLRNVVSTLKGEAAVEIPPLLEIAQMLRRQKNHILQGVR